MRIQPRSNSRSAKARRPVPRPIPFTFQCTCCETVEHRPTPALPQGWATEMIGDDIFAYCGGCAIDLPRDGGQIQ